MSPSACFVVILCEFYFILFFAMWRMLHTALKGIYNDSRKRVTAWSVEEGGGWEGAVSFVCVSSLSFPWTAAGAHLGNSLWLPLQRGTLLNMHHLHWWVPVSTYNISENSHLLPHCLESILFFLSHLMVFPSGCSASTWNIVTIPLKWYLFICLHFSCFLISWVDLPNFLMQSFPPS